LTAESQRFVDWLAAELFRRGTRFAFGVPGGGVSLDLLAAAQSAGMRTVITAREDAAAIMAGVAGRLTNAPGLAFSTKGPGLASATNGLASALLDRMPLLFVAESFDPAELSYLSHQVFDQSALAAGLFGDLAGGKAQVLQAEAGAIVPALNAIMAAPSGPSVLLADPKLMTAPIGELPADSISRPDADSTAIERARELISCARRPIIVAGLEATTADSAAGVLDLASALGAPALVTYMAKGVVPDVHPNFAGIFTGGSIEQTTVGNADLIILVGLDPVELIRKPWPYQAPVVDICRHAHVPHYFEPAARVAGDLATTLASLAEHATGSDWRDAEIVRHRASFHEGMTMPAGDGLSPEAVVREVGQAFEFAPRLTVDAGAHMFSACAFWQARNPLDVLISNGLASMGFALPAAIAAALHDPGRGAVAMTGDGGLLMCLGELKTAAALGVNLTVVVFNDARLSLIDIKREERQMRDLGLSWEAPDFACAADGFGFSTWRAESQTEISEAAAAAAATNGPCLIDARIDASGYRSQLRALRG
jgi:acetolactate synthase-1/2/3 large subunit